MLTNDFEAAIGLQPNNNLLKNRTEDLEAVISSQSYNGILDFGTGKVVKNFDIFWFICTLMKFTLFLF